MPEHDEIEIEEQDDDEPTIWELGAIPGCECGCGGDWAWALEQVTDEEQR